MQIVHKLGSLENPIRAKRTAANVLSVRNNSIVQYYNNSEIVGNRKGTVSTLKQNLKTEYLERVNNLSRCDTFFNVSEHTQNIEEQYDKHKKELELKYWSDYIDFTNGKRKKKPIKVTPKPLGTMSKIQVKKVRMCLENLVSMVLMGYKPNIDMYSQQFLTFVTLTLPSKQIHSDKILRKAQTRFIENLQKSYNVVHYVWKAETQENGNIHFHILIDRAVHYTDIQRLWNNQLNKLGYIKRYAEKRKKEGFIYKPFFYKNGIKRQSKTTKLQQLNNYKKELKEDFSNPNTTDIHSLKKVQNTVSYIMKYLTKLEPTKRPIIGAVWGAGNLTKKLTYPKFYESENAFNQLMQLINSKRFKCVLMDDFFSVFTGKVYDIIRKEFKNTIWREMKKHYATLRGYTKDVQNKINDSLKLNTVLNNLNQQIQNSKSTFKKQPLQKPKYIQKELFRIDIYNNLVPT